jgi:DNA-binding PadR family transcriptional regulator
MELSPTAYVILGMLRKEARSGYEIKQVVDRSTRFFWAASYGQIYPELARLAEAGLVAGKEQATGGRKRTVYRLTRAGRAELRRWLEELPERLELRDEGLLKLFFAGAVDRDHALEIVDAKRRMAEEQLAALHAIEPHAAETSAEDPYPYLVLRYGIEMGEWTVAWCERTRAELKGGR